MKIKQLLIGSLLVTSMNSFAVPTIPAPSNQLCGPNKAGCPYKTIEQNRLPGATHTTIVRTPYGWLVVLQAYSGAVNSTFVPDPYHQWKYPNEN